MLKEKKLNKISTYVCLGLMVILLVLQFLPYWNFTSAESGEATLSIGDYVWFPNDPVSDELEDIMKVEAFDDASLNDREVVNEIVMLPAWAFGLALAAFAIIILKRNSSIIPGIVSIIASLTSILSYLLNPALSVSGGNASADSWIIHLIVCVVVLLVAIALLVLNIREVKAAKKAEKAA